MASMNASTAGLRVLRGILDLPTKHAGAELMRVQPYLTYDEDQKVFDFVRSHFASTGKMPHPDTILDKVSVFLPPAQETFDFEVGQLKNRFIEDSMRAASDKASSLLLEGNAKAALASLISDLLPVTQGQGGYSLTDLRHTQVVALYEQALAGLGPPIEELGYPSLDAQGGIENGDMMAIVGRPASGKTWLMLKTALNHWSKQAEPHMFVTQEMSAEQIERRALPMIAGVNPTPLYKGSAHTYEVGGLTHEAYLSKLEEARVMLNHAQSPFLIYDSKMAGTVADIETIAAMHGVKRIWIDGAYMLRHPDPRLGRYARVPENLDLMKQWCQRTGCATISSWQFKRGAGKDEQGGTPDLDDIGYSHAIGEYMTLILGLLENPKSVAQMNKKHITIMKGRNGEVGGFEINWLFSEMNFDEITPQEMTSDLTYL